MAGLVSANPENCVFTEQELKDKENELLSLIKRTIIEFRKSWLKRNEHRNAYYSPIPSSFPKDTIIFHNSRISIKFDGSVCGTAVIWGRQRKNKDKWFPKNLKIIFALNTPDLLIKIDTFMEYPHDGNSVIKDIFYRMNINSQEDYNLLLRSFEGLLVSYI